ncbi:MAG: chromosomal replication initiator protein DnaA [Clostridiales bacterium]|nr:chromosomal replication initiator protein DnaA [Clostridiales bacterium]
MNSFMEIWKSVQDYCKTQITEVAFNVWIAPLTLVRMDESTALLSIEDTFKKEIVAVKFNDLLSDAFEQVLGFPIRVEIVVTDEVKDPEPAKVQSEEYEYTFETFIVGSSNKFAHAAAQAVAANPGGAYNPLFIYGNSGLGKTHLLNAICYEIRRSNPEADILYVRGEDFTNELITSIAEKKMIDFHNKYRNVDVLLVDDVQFISGKIQTQEEFFHTFENLSQAGKQIVLTSDRPPKEILTLEDRLRTRFEWGLLADIQPPDLETRIAIVKRKAQLLDINLPDDVTEYIAQKLKTNIRQLEGAVKRMKAYHSIEGHPPTILLAQRAIKDILSDSQPVPVTVEKIIQEVARTYGITEEDIRSNKRDSTTSKARQAAMYIVREVTGLPMKAIGDEFGGRDHSTVLYTLTKIEKEMEKNPSLKATISDTIKNIQDQ